ncbi:MAG: SMC-Scp complex subunit ScpB [Candidatus Woesearchaeota archaeon]
MDEELKKKIEAILFSIGRKIHIDELLKMIKEKDKAKVIAGLIELKQKYNNDDNNSLMILQDGDFWKLTIKDQYIDVAKEIGVETELTKTVMETLAVIAYKYPILQSDVIKIRTNKAYDHLSELETLGYIQRERYGRTKQIKLTQKFFDYFDLPPDKLKETFHNVKEMEKVISEKENQIHEINQKKKEMIEEQEKESKRMESKNIYMTPREIIQHQENGIDIIEGEKLGELEIFEDYDSDNNSQIENDSENKRKDIEIFDDVNNNLMQEQNSQDIENNPEFIDQNDNSEPDNKDINLEMMGDELNKEHANNMSNDEIIEPISDSDNSNDNDILDQADINNNQTNEQEMVEKNDKNNEQEIPDNNNLDTDLIDSGSTNNEQEINEDSNNNENESSSNNINENQDIDPNNEQDNLEDKNKNEEINGILKQDDEEDNLEKADEKTDEQNKKEELTKEETDINLNEENIFNMEGIPKNIMDKIEKKVEEIMDGEEKEFFSPSDKEKNDS